MLKWATRLTLDSLAINELQDFTQESDFQRIRCQTL